MYYTLPQADIVQREDYVVRHCTGKRVVHLGAAQANDANDFGAYGSLIDPRNFLHARLTAAALCCIGIDYNAVAIEHLRAHYGITNIALANIESRESLAVVDFVPEVIVLGEIIEHLPNPGIALRNIRDNLMGPDTRLIVTMPNALDAANFLYGALRRESHDPDHVVAYTPHLFGRLCEKEGLSVVDLKYYQVTMTAGSRNFYRIERWSPRKLLLFLYYNIVLRISRGFCSGLIATVARA